MATQTADQLVARRCKPCEGGVEPLEPEAAKERMAAIDRWQLSDDGKAIARSWTLRDFRAAVALLNQVAELAEEEQHHPDLHLTGYRKLRIELTTHAIGGLSENDLIVAAKIDRLPAAAAE